MFQDLARKAVNATGLSGHEFRNQVFDVVGMIKEGVDGLGESSFVNLIELKPSVLFFEFRGRVQAGHVIFNEFGPFAPIPIFVDASW